MEPQQLWNVLTAGGMAAVGWVLRTFYAALRELERDLSAHKETVAKTYATNDSLNRIENKIDRILERVERKADR